MRKGSVIAEARVGVMYAHGQDRFQISFESFYLG